MTHSHHHTRRQRHPAPGRGRHEGAASDPPVPAANGGVGRPADVAPDRSTSPAAARGAPRSPAPCPASIDALRIPVEFALWPFTQLVHVFSVPVGYLWRP